MSNGMSRRNGGGSGDRERGRGGGRRDDYDDYNGRRRYDSLMYALILLYNQA